MTLEPAFQHTSKSHINKPETGNNCKTVVSPHYVQVELRAGEWEPWHAVGLAKEPYNSLIELTFKVSPCTSPLTSTRR